MAQTLQQQDTQNSSASDNKPPHTTQHSTSIRAGRQVANTIAPKKASAVAVKTLESPPAVAVVPATARYQASKQFIARCREELNLLLESIKDSYNNQIKTLYTDESLADIYIEVGQELKKPLHRCILASRSYKLYSALKAFQVVNLVEQDIVISQFQNTDIENKSCENRQEQDLDDDQSITFEKESEVLPITCTLPAELVSGDLLLNFLRRVYLDQDLSEEEVKIHQRFKDWIKIHMPDTIKSTRQTHSPNHKESFRTVRPDFEESSPPKNPVMSPEPNSALNEDTESNIEDVDEHSQATSARDESLTSSLLPRTETFELIAKSNPDSPSIATQIIKATDSLVDDDEEDLSADVSNSDNSSTPTPFVPVTRTGLKPKTFTTPKGSGLRGTRSSITSSGDKKPTKLAAKPPSRDTPKTAAAASGSSLKKDISSKQSSSGSSVSRSSTQLPETATDAQQTKSSSRAKTSSAIGTSGKVKPTVITRALPISMERSQSPSTSTMKGSTKNFLLANKRIISKMEKKSPTPVDQNVEDSEIEASDSSSFVLESYTMDHIVSLLDKFTLVSYSRLAESLCRMFIDGKLSDVTIFVRDGKEILAHKCILAARSDYLNEYITKQTLSPTIGSDSSITKEQLKIDLNEFSYATVYFCIMHIYSGVVKVPDDLDLDELCKLSHLLHVTTLTQVCMHNLKVNYCHFFHKPCNVCCLGVLKTLPLAWRYDYTELYSKSLQWIGSHFANIFCLKEFSELKPHDLLEECYTATLSQLTPDNIIPKTIECQKLLKNLPRVKWSESVICLVGRQLEDFCHYVADNYEKILQSESFLNLGKNCWECEILEENLLAAMNHLKPDSGCKTLIQLHKLECSNESYCDEPRGVSDSFANLVSKMAKYCERYLLKEAAAVVHCSSWRRMNPALQKRIRDQAVITADFDEPTKQLSSKPKLPSMSRLANQQQQSSRGNSSGSEDTKSPSNRSTPEAKLRTPSTTYLPPPKSKTAAARHVKVLK